MVNSRNLAFQALVLALHFATTKIGYSRPAVSPNEACKHPIFLK
jgi:hypothetical protein